MERIGKPRAPALVQVNIQARTRGQTGHGRSRDVYDAIVVEVSGDDIDRITAARSGVSTESLDRLERAIPIAESHGNSNARSMASMKCEIKICFPVTIEIGGVQSAGAGRCYGKKSRCKSATCVGEQIVGFLAYHATGVAAGVLIKQVHFPVAIEVAGHNAAEKV